MRGAESSQERVGEKHASEIPGTVIQGPFEGAHHTRAVPITGRACARSEPMSFIALGWRIPSHHGSGKITSECCAIKP